jgi:chaperone modulatory protein CbpM
VTELLKEQEFLQLTRLDHATLRIWIAEAWLAPSETAGEVVFSDLDLARARLILDLKQDMGVNDEGVGVILHLVDQMHGLRRVMSDLLKTLHESAPR